MSAKGVKVDGVGISADLVLSFETEKLFIAKYINRFWLNLDVKERKTRLKKLYAEAQKFKEMT